MGELKFTAPQQEVINFRNNNLLVSAGAGSGKTTVMIERIATLLTDKDHPVPISKFLIISFTKASAADMKNKLINKLSNMEPTAYILEQLDDILTSDVSNLHSFCARLLKLYFYEVGLDPTFVVLDENETAVLKDKALDKLFQEKTANADKDFYALIDIFAKSRSDKGLKRAILKLYNFLCSITNSHEWFEQKINTLYDTNLDQNTGAKIILSHMFAEKKRMQEEISNMIKKCQKYDLIKLVAYLQELESKVLLIREDQGLIENAKRLEDIARQSNIPQVDEKFEDIKIEVSALKEDVISRIRKLKEYSLSGETEDIERNLQRTQQNIYNLYKLEREFEDIFASLKKEKGGLDFNDLEQYSLKVLSNPVLLEEVKNKYEYIMVDEYQDINSVQEQILTLIAKDNNRFMVGDIKQSIYRFRLCDPQIFLDKYNKYSNDQSQGKLVKLNENFRSKKGILDFVNSVFAETMTKDFGGVDYKNEAILKAGNDSQIDDQMRVEFLIADTENINEDSLIQEKAYSVKEDDESAFLERKGKAEGLMIAHKISYLMANTKIEEKDRKRKLKFSDITILVPKRTSYLDKIIETLQENGIPVATDVEGDCFEDEYVYSLKSLLEVLSCKKVDISLFSLLKSKLFNFSATEIAKIKIAGGSEKFFYQNVDNAWKKRKLDEKLQKKLDDFFEFMERYRQKAKFMCASDIVKQVVDEKNLIVKISFEPDGEKTKQRLSKFISSLKDQTIFEFLSDEGLKTISCDPIFSSDSVKVMTVHKSKGLEFKVVFLAMCANNFNLEGVKSDLVISKDIGICMDYYDREKRYKTSNIAREAVRLVETRKMLEEQQRLLYVALTRATDYLYLVASVNYNKIPEKMPSSPMKFMDFMGHLVKNPEKYTDANYNIVIANANDILSENYEKEKRQVIFADVDENKVDFAKQILNYTYPFENEITKPLKIAVTSAISDEIENQSFKVEFNEEQSKSSASLGTLYHFVLSKLDLFKSEENEIQKQIDTMVNDGILSNDEAENINAKEISLLLSNKEFKNLICDADKIYKEKEFYMLYEKENQTPSVMQGIVDLLIIKNNKLIILDYKTGNLSNKEILEKYTRQVEIYALAMKKCFDMEIDKMCIASVKNGKMIFVKNI